MGSDKQSTQSSGTTTYTPTPQEVEMQKLQLGQYQQTVGPQTQLQLQGMDVVSKLLAGEALPGTLNELQMGVSPGVIGTASAELARQSMPGLQSMGILESGEALRSISNDIANQILFPATQFNLQNRLNMLGLATGQQVNLQNAATAQSTPLSQSLAGLRSVNQQTSGSTRTTQGFGSMVVSPFFQGFGSAVGNYFAPK
jgi:hypothetical protein